MLKEPNCFKRLCKHYEGVVLLREADESSETHVCPAFPEGIPTDITYGKNLHEEIHPAQNDEKGILYELRK